MVEIVRKKKVIKFLKTDSFYILGTKQVTF